MADLVEWLRAQLNDDEAAAEACLPLHLRVGRFRGKEVPRWRITKSGNGIIDEDGGTLRAQQIFPAEADHVVRHDPARVLREIEIDRELLAEYERLLRAHEAHRKEADRLTRSDDDPIRRNALRREADYLPAMLHVMERWAKRKAAVYSDRPGYAEAVASVG